MLDVWGHTPEGIDAPGVDHPRLAQPVEAFGSILGAVFYSTMSGTGGMLGLRREHKGGHFPRAKASQAGADTGARLFLIFGTSEQEAPVTGALFTEHLKINNLERILPKWL